MSKQALIFGATGAIGRKLLEFCLVGDRYSQTTVIARRPATLEHDKLQWIESEYDALNQLQPIKGCADGDAYCCLGTTIKAAGSKAAFRQVDHDFVVNAARFAKRSGARQFSLVSAIGANPDTRAFYSRVKGQAESAVIAESFPVLRIFRPSLLKGERDEFRLGEELGNWVGVILKPVFELGLKKYQPVEIARVASAMYLSAEKQESAGGHFVYESDEIQDFPISPH